MDEASGLPENETGICTRRKKKAADKQRLFIV